MTVAPHVFIGLNALGKMEVLENYYSVYQIKSYKEKEGYFKEEQIKELENFLRNEFPEAFVKRRHKENSAVRQSICYLLECFKVKIGCSRISQIFNQNHATVIHSRTTVADNWLKYEGYEDKIEILKKVKVKLMPYLITMEFELKNQ